LSLIRNGRSIFQSPGRFSGVIQNQNGEYITGAFRNRMVGGLSETFGGYSNGYLAPYSFILPTKSGSIATYNTSFSSISKTDTNMAAGRNLEGSSVNSISVTDAQLDQIVSFVASALSAILCTGSLEAAIEMQASAVLQLTGTASVGAIVDALASANMQITPVAIITALAHMNAEAGGPTPLSPEGLAAAVWGKDISSFDTPGTAGLKLNNAGSAGNPWDAETATSNDPGTFGALVQKLLTVSKYLGLK